MSETVTNFVIAFACEGVGVFIGAVVAYQLCVAHLVKHQNVVGPDGTTVATVAVRFGRRAVRANDVSDSRGGGGPW